jgi:hypothetical protein
LLQAFGYTAEHKARSLVSMSVKGLTALGFVGGGCAIVACCAPLLWRKSKLIWGVIAAALTCVLSWWALGQMPNYSPNPARFSIACQWALAIVAGIGALTLPFRDLKRHWNAETLLLVLWVVGTFAFCLLNWTVNSRSVLPMMPALALLLIRALERQPMPRGINYCFAASAVLSLLVCAADYSLAGSARAAAARIRETDQSAVIWFEGHWGFQYYAERKGLRAFDTNLAEPRPGDVLVLPANNTNVHPIPEDSGEPPIPIEVPVFPLITTMNRFSGAGFYWDAVGPLPFVFGSVGEEKYYLLRFR